MATKTTSSTRFSRNGALLGHTAPDTALSTSTALRLGPWACAFAAVLFVGCASNADETGAGGGATTGDTVGGSGGTAGEGGAGTGGVVSGPTTIGLPQLVDGAALANPAVYASIPLRVTTDPPADSVEVVFNQNTVVATPGIDGVFVADVPLAGVTGGVEAFTVHATRGDEVSDASGEIVLSATGVQLTDFDIVGSAGTPRLHKRADELWLTWTDRRNGDAEAWLQRIDGGARAMGEPVALVQAGEETLSARCAFGSNSVGVLYQGLGGPYTNSFKIVDFDGSELVAPIALDGALYGSFGGDIVFDGEAFIFVWRSNNGSASSSLQWMRVSESGDEVVGPVVVAAAGSDDPHGGFDPTTFISVRRIAGKSVVSFVRDWYFPALELSVPKSQFAVVDDDGTVSSGGFLSSETQYTFHREARLFNVGDELVAIWSAIDLLDQSNDPPLLMFGGRTDASGTFSIIGKGLAVVDAAGQRDEPFVVSHPDHRGVMVWTDNRTGNIELYAAALGDDLAATSEKMFTHANFVASTGLLHAVDLGGNAVVTWRDNRHGFGILDPRPEMWVETAWY